MPEHVGYAGRTAEKFRYDGDPNEVMLRISKEAAADILWAREFATRSALEQVCEALEALGLTFRDESPNEDDLLNPPGQGHTPEPPA